jgi:hypothetical protein
MHKHTTWACHVLHFSVNDFEDVPVLRRSLELSQSSGIPVPYLSLPYLSPAIVSRGKGIFIQITGDGYALSDKFRDNSHIRQVGIFRNCIIPDVLAMPCGYQEQIIFNRDQGAEQT